jgi:hypothetical protein
MSETDTAEREGDAALRASLRGRVTRQAAVMTLVLALVVGAAIWLLVFDMWLGQVERQYLFENAWHELKRGPAVSLKAMVDEGRAMGARVATGWAALVAAAILLAGRYGYVKGKIAGATWTH